MMRTIVRAEDDLLILFQLSQKGIVGSNNQASYDQLSNQKVEGQQEEDNDGDDSVSYID